jgi:hypothetical protein
MSREGLENAEEDVPKIGRRALVLPADLAELPFHALG